MTIDEYRDAIFANLALRSGYSFTPEAGPIPTNAKQRFLLMMDSYWDCIQDAFDAGQKPEHTASEILLYATSNGWL